MVAIRDQLIGCEVAAADSCLRAEVAGDFRPTAVLSLGYRGIREEYGQENEKPMNHERVSLIYFIL
jgi:hypothetical protein